MSEQSRATAAALLARLSTGSAEIASAPSVATSSGLRRINRLELSLIHI